MARINSVMEDNMPQVKIVSISSPLEMFSNIVRLSRCQRLQLSQNAAGSSSVELEPPSNNLGDHIPMLSIIATFASVPVRKMTEVIGRKHISYM